MRRITIILCFLLTLSLPSFTQNAAINSDGSAPDGSAMLDVKSTEKGMLIPRMTSTQRQAISTPAEGLMVYQTDGLPGFYYFDGSNWYPVGGKGGHYVGELYAGGVVAWVDPSGQHGFVVSMISNGTNVWSNLTADTVGYKAQSDWDGVANTNAIVAQSGSTTSAAKVCLNYVNAEYGTGVYDDWYLPARGELNYIWKNLYSVQKALDEDGDPVTTPLTPDYTWSSTEFNGITSYSIPFYIGFTYRQGKGNPSHVRCVRAF